MVNRDPDQWGELIDKARPVVAHVMETLSRDQNLDDPKVKSTIAAQVLPLIDDIPDAIERDTYLQRLSRMLEINERTLLSFRPEKKRRSPTREKRELPVV